MACAILHNMALKIDQWDEDYQLEKEDNEEYLDRAEDRNQHTAVIHRKHIQAIVLAYNFS
jgi:hypothetical protein